MKEDYDQARTTIIATATAVVILAALLGWLLTRNITRPIQQIVEIANKVASGNLTVDVRSNRGDEFGHLLAAFGTMVTNLRAVIGEIGTGANSIASSSEELSAASNQTSAAVTSQRDKTDQVATAMNAL